MVLISWHYASRCFLEERSKVAIIKIVMIVMITNLMKQSSHTEASRFRYVRPDEARRDEGISEEVRFI